MQPSIRRLILSALSLCVLLPAVAPAESTPQATKWLEKFMGVYEQGPFSTKYTADIEIDNGDQSVDGSMDGSLTYRDPSHMHMEMSMLLAGIPGAPADQTMEMQMLSVSDGELTWTQIDMPALGMQQVMKISLEDAKKLAGAQGVGMGNPAPMDPVQQLRSMTEQLDFELVKVEAGEAHLEAKITDEAKTSLGQMAALPGLETMTLILDEKTGFPRRFSMGGERPIVAITFSDFKFLDEKSLAADLFVYTPPQGVQIMDLGAMTPAAQPVDQ